MVTCYWYALQSASQESFGLSVRDVLPGESETIMKRTDITENSHDEAQDDMLPEYHFDYSKARPNRFARDIAEGSLIIVLEPELARVFKTPEQVKTILRAIADALPQQETES
jgi:hypothetical protein